MRLRSAFKDKEDGNSIKNGLHSIWLLYFSEYIFKTDKTKQDNTFVLKRKTGSVLLTGIYKFYEI